MRFFDINFHILIKLLIPKFIRQPKTLAWLGALISPIETLYAKFTAYRNQTEYDLKHTSQRVHIQAVLNDRWDSGLRRIVLVDGAHYDPIYTYKTGELRPVYLRTIAEAAPKWLYTIEEIEQPGIDFIVQVPNFIVFDENEMKALIDKYCLPGKTYSIIPV